MLRINCTASCAGFFKVRNERWEAKTFAFFFFPFRFLLCLSLELIIQLKYPKNHRERLRTRQVNCMLIMKSNSMFRGRHLNKQWRNKSFMRIEYYREL